METFIQTYSGRRVSLINPDPNDIALEDIAYALARQCRFGGHCREFYSVAQHSVLVSELLEETTPLASRGADWDLLMQGLMHDATEAYVVDVPSPLKELLPEYKKIECRMEVAIWRKFGIRAKLPRVKKADVRALGIEARQLMVRTTDWEVLKGVPDDHRKLHPTDAKEAEKEFLRHFYWLDDFRNGRRKHARG